MNAESNDLKTYIKKDIIMLTTIAVVLIVLWLLGFLSSYTMGGIIHILLVIAVIMILVRLISGRKAL
jgi:predicted RND superfamily exporter protein